MLNGVQLINGSDESFDIKGVSGYNDRTLYLVRSNNEASDGYLHLNGKTY